MNNWKDDGEFETRKGRIQHKGGGKWIESRRKTTIHVQESYSTDHAKTITIGAT